jgi:hypothetical protein
MIALTQPIQKVAIFAALAAKRFMLQTFGLSAYRA